MHEPFLNKIHLFITQHDLIPKGSTIIIGLSGGPDSVFLLYFLAALRAQKNITVIAAHLDHEWRPESSKDTEFCRELTKKLEIKLVVAKISDLEIPSKFNGSKEEFGRRARRIFLERVCKQEQAHVIALAHHLQDQEETFFIRLIRGTSLTGLTAMRPKYGLYIRPLLETDKKDILEYLKKHAISYLIDPSNITEDFLRNRIRNKVIPALLETDARFTSNFLATLHRLQATEQFLEHLTANIYDEICSQKEGRCFINVTQFLKLDVVLQKRIIIHWLCQEKVSFYPQEAFLDEIIRFLKQAESKEHRIHTSWSITKKKNTAAIKKY